MRTLVVDTDVVSFIFNRHSLSAPYLDLVAGNELVISFMTLAELRLGVMQANWGPRRRAQLDEYLDHYRIHFPDKPSCDTWARVTLEAKGLGRVISPQDAWIAATALELAAPLVTHNARDFQRILGLKIETAYIPPAGPAR